ncbi:hypothetical protein ACP70R_020653 [Stipagrostis hirtigluma subsp. patula]
MGSLDAKPDNFATNASDFQLLNADDVRSYLHMSVDFIYDYYKSVESQPVLPGAPRGHRAGDHTLGQPNIYAFFAATNSAAASTSIAFAMNTVGFTWKASPAATEMEVLALNWLAQLRLLPASVMNRTGSGRGNGGSVILGTTSKAMLVMLVAARDVALCRSGSNGVAGITRLTLYAADQTHSTLCHLTSPMSGPVRLIWRTHNSIQEERPRHTRCSTMGSSMILLIAKLGALARIDAWSVEWSSSVNE